MCKVTDREAVDKIQRSITVGFLVHSGTDRERALFDHLPVLEARLQTQMYTLARVDIEEPTETLFAFTKYPRILVYRNGSTEKEYVGFNEIVSLIS